MFSQQVVAIPDLAWDWEASHDYFGENPLAV